MKKTTSRKVRHSISVSGKIYDRLRAAVPHGGVSGFVDSIILSGLDDPTILARLIDKCRRAEVLS